MELGENVCGLPEYEFKALRYVEHYGIIDYQVNGNIMEYKEKYKNEGEFTHKVNLDNLKEE